jgi:hypothetical protein
MITVERSEVIRAAGQAIRAAERRHGYQVTNQLRDELMNVAETATQISFEWSVGEHCGCLVGTARMRRGECPIPRTNAVELAIGEMFPEILRGAWLGETYFDKETDREYGPDDVILTIVDTKPKEVTDMDIGKEERTIIVEPVENPVPQEPMPATEPAHVPTPAEEPAKV